MYYDFWSYKRQHQPVVHSPIQPIVFRTGNAATMPPKVQRTYGSVITQHGHLECIIQVDTAQPLSRGKALKSYFSSILAT
jgi:hypothetical protein